MGGKKQRKREERSSRDSTPEVVFGVTGNSLPNMAPQYVYTTIGQSTSSDSCFGQPCSHKVSNTSNEEMSFHNKHPNAVWLCPACDINFFTSAFFDSASDLANSIDVSNPLESLSASDEGVSDPVETPRV